MKTESAALRKPVPESISSRKASQGSAFPDAPVTAISPRVSAIIVTYNTGDSLWECLASVARDSSIGEAVIVNNGNPKDQEAKLEAFARQHEKFRILAGHGNIGFSKACNAGARLAAGRYFLFLNPDAVLEEGAVNALIAAGEDRPGVWLTGGMLLDVFGKEQRGARRGKLTLWNAAASFSGFSGLLQTLCGGQFANVHWENTQLPTDPICVPTVSGAFMLTPAAHFWEIGGFDEAYFLHVEDIDLCRRIGDVGGEVVFAPSAKAMHYGSTSSASRIWIEWQKGRGLDIYFKKFARSRTEAVAASLLSPMIRAALVLRALYFSLHVQRRSAKIKRLRAKAGAKANERKLTGDLASAGSSQEQTPRVFS